MKKITLAIILSAMLLMTGCNFFKPSNNISADTIYEEQKNNLNPEKVEKQAETMSDKLRDNVQKNSDRQFDEIMEMADDLDTSPAREDMAPEDYIEAVAKKWRNGIWRTFVVFVGSLQSIAIPGGIVVAMVLLLLAIFLRKDRKKLKNCIIFIIVDGILVLFILYSPALLWSLNK